MAGTRGLRHRSVCLSQSPSRSFETARPVGAPGRRRRKVYSKQKAMNEGDVGSNSATPASVRHHPHVTLKINRACGLWSKVFLDTLHARQAATASVKRGPFFDAEFFDGIFIALITDHPPLRYWRYSSCQRLLVQAIRPVHMLLYV